MFKDVNPDWDPTDRRSPEFLYGLDAVFASVSNLISCPRGGRSLIGNVDYWSSVYQLLQEPHDHITASKLELALRQAIKQWEPRIEWSFSPVIPVKEGYSVSLTATLSGQVQTENLTLRK